MRLQPLVPTILALVFVALGILVMLQRFSGASDGRGVCQETTREMSATPGAALEASDDQQRDVTVTSYLDVWEDDGAVILGQAIVITLPSSEPQVSALLGEPSEERYRDALNSLLTRREVKPRGAWEDFREVGPLEDSATVVNDMAAVAQIDIRDEFATVTILLEDHAISGYPDAIPDGTGMWVIGHDERDILLTNLIKNNVRPQENHAWYSVVCISGMQVVSISPVPVMLEHPHRVVWDWTAFGADSDTGALRLELRPDAGTTFKLWLLSGDLRHLPVAWSFLAPAALLVAAFVIAQPSPHQQTPDSPKGVLRALTTVSLTFAGAALFYLGTLAFRTGLPSESDTSWRMSSTAIVLIVIVVGGAILLRYFSAGIPLPFLKPRPESVPATPDHGELREDIRTGDVEESSAWMRAVELVLNPGVIILGTVVWWFAMVWTRSGSLSGAPSQQSLDYDALSRLLAVAAFASILCAAVKSLAAPATICVVATVLGLILATPASERAGALLPVWTVVLFLAASLGLAAALAVSRGSLELRETQEFEYEAPERGNFRYTTLKVAIASGVALVTLGTLIQWLRSSYRTVELPLRVKLDADPTGEATGWYENILSERSLHFPIGFLGPATDVILILGLLSVVGIIHPTGNVPATRTWSPWAYQLLILIFAAFVVGYGGEALGYRLPLAFLIALAVMHLALRPPTSSPDETGASGGAHAPSVQEPRPASPEHEGDSEPLASPGPSDPNPSLDRGPTNDLWQCGMLALRGGAVIAVLPVAYFLYLLVSSGADEILAPEASFGGITLVTTIAYEILFWLTAALALGALFTYLRGPRGVVKGVVLTAVYAASHGIAALLLGREANELWEVRTFQLLLFLAVLGAWLDYNTLRARNRPVRDLLVHYHVNKVQFAAGYVTPLLVTLGMVIRQLYTGQTEDAVSQILSSVTQQVAALPFFP